MLISVPRPQLYPSQLLPLKHRVGLAYKKVGWFHWFDIGATPIAAEDDDREPDLLVDGDKIQCPPRSAACLSN
jgi:hypothetical protein